MFSLAWASGPALKAGEFQREKMLRHRELDDDDKGAVRRLVGRRRQGVARRLVEQRRREGGSLVGRATMRGGTST